MKNKYDTSVVFLYSIGKEHLLPKEFRRKIPYSTIANWRKNDYDNYLGNEFRLFFDQAFNSAELSFRYAKLKKTMMSLARSWVTLSHIMVPIVKNSHGDKRSQNSILTAVNLMRNHLGFERALKLMGLSKTLYYQWTTEARFDCFDSYTQLCVKRHPQQLEIGEIQKIKTLLNDPRTEHWPIVSVAAEALRKKEIVCSLYSREKISYIIVYSVDRFSRSGANAIYIKDQLREQGIYLVAVTQPGDASTSSGDFQQNIQIIFSQYDNQLRREKCMAGVKEALLKGEWCHKAPYGYDEIKENGKRKIVLNEKGKLLQKAFYWKATERITHTEISERLDALGLKLNEKRLSGYFRNPFYCGLMAHSALKGQLVEGNQEKMVSKEIFLKVNEILSENRHGYSCHEEAEEIPLKRFLKCDHCGSFMRGYVVKAKNLPYYKCNTKGCCNNKSAREIHGLFESVLKYFSLFGNEAIKGFVTKQLVANYNRAHKEKDQSKEAIKRQITEIEKRLERMEERLVNEELTLEIYSKHSLKLKQERLDLEKSLIKNQKRVSNLEQCVNIIMDYIANLPSSWALMAYKDKQLLQFLLFPEGIRYSKKNNECRTTKINSVFSYISGLVRDLAEMKMGDIKLSFNIPHLVGPLGIEPSTHSPDSYRGSLLLVEILKLFS